MGSVVDIIEESMALERDVDVLPMSYEQIHYSANGNGGKLVFGDLEGVDIIPAAMQFFVSKVMRIPWYYWERCSDQLREENISEWLQRTDTVYKVLVDRSVNRVVGVLPSTWVNMPIYRVLEGVEENELLRGEYYRPSGGDAALFVEIGADEEFFGFRPSLTFVNNDVGLRPLEVCIGLYKQVCSNGARIAVGDANIVRHHPRAGRLYYDDDVVKRVIPLVLSGLVERLRNNVEILGGVRLVEVYPPFSKDIIASSCDVDTFEDALLLNPTMLDLVDKVTQKVQEMGFSTRVKVEKKVGKILYSPNTALRKRLVGESTS
jgi:hypothetical protein